MNNAIQKYNKPWAWQLCFIMLLTSAVLLLPDLALASQMPDPNTIGAVLCRVVDWFSGPVGKGIATLAIIIIGVGALMGKVSWGMAIIVGIGVAVVFGAGPLVDSISNTSNSCT